MYGFWFHLWSLNFIYFLPNNKSLNSCPQTNNAPLITGRKLLNNCKKKNKSRNRKVPPNHKNKKLTMKYQTPKNNRKNHKSKPLSIQSKSLKRKSPPMKLCLLKSFRKFLTKSLNLTNSQAKRSVTLSWRVTRISITTQNS